MTKSELVSDAIMCAKCAMSLAHGINRNDCYLEQQDIDHIGQQITTALETLCWAEASLDCSSYEVNPNNN